jgi:glycosyltransferase involved in cell wall biosynthesis
MLRRCLASVRAALGPDDELIVVDSASSDPAGVKRVVTDAGATLLRCPERGASLARNVGWRAACHDMIAYTDDDVWVDPGWANAFASSFAARPDVAFLTGRIEVPSSQVTTDRPVAIKDDAEAHAIDSSTAGVLGHSASLAVRAEALHAVGGFDEALGAGGRFRAGEDSDLLDRLIARGFRGRYEPAALAWHDQWRDRRELVHLDYGYGYGAGARLAKLARADRPKARALAKELYWTHGLREAGRNLRSGWQYGAVMRLAQVGGATAGLVRAMSETVHDGHLQRR